MSDNLQMVDWYQVDANGNILANGMVQMAHVGDIAQLPGASIRTGIRANPLTDYEAAPGAVAAYTLAQLAARGNHVPGFVWNPRAMKWVKG